MNEFGVKCVVKVLIGILFFAGLSSCATVLNPEISYAQLMERRSVQAKAVEMQADTSTCQLNSKIHLEKFILHNNLWGKSRIPEANPQLCSFQNENGIGWKWQMPENARGVIGYPAIQYGSGPWHVTKKTHGFPVMLDSIQHLTADYDAQMWVKGRKYNLAFDLWLSLDYYSRPETVTTEIMVWEEYHDFRSFGSKVDQISTPFGDYDVMKGYLKNDEFGQDWAYFAFIRKEQRNAGKVDLQYLLRYLIENHNVDSSQYLTSVEFGNEIGNSSGFTWIKEFSLELDQIESD